MNIIHKKSNLIIVLICLIFSVFIPINSWYGFPISIFSNEQTYYSAFQGVFPWSDANGYFDGPKIFASTGFLDAWNTRRPFTSLYYSSLNFISFNNYYFSLIIRNFLFALALSSSLIIINKKFGYLTTILTAFFIFAFSSGFLPTTLTETVGLTLGFLSFSICWFSIEKRNLALFLFGIFMFCIALNARSGAFFILPLLLIYLILNFSKYKTNIEKLKLFLFGILSISSSFLISFLLSKYYGNQSGEGIMQGNFAPTLYGLVTGGKGWGFAYKIYPNFQGSEADFFSFLYKESLNYFLNHPKDIFIGFALNFIEGLKKFLLFTKFLPTFFNLIITILFIMSIAYVFIKLRQSNQKIIDFLGLGLLSYFLSACIIAQDGGMRVFSVTIIFNFIAISITISYFLKRLSNKEFSISNKFIYFPMSVTSIILFLAILLTGYRQAFTIPYKDNYTRNLKCKENEINEIIERANNQPYIYIDKNDHIAKKSFAFLKRNPYSYTLLIQKSNIENQEYFSKLLNEKDQPFILGHFSNQTGNSKNFIASKDIIKEKSDYIEICYTLKTYDHLDIGTITHFQPAQKIENTIRTSLN